MLIFCHPVSLLLLVHYNEYQFGKMKPLHALTKPKQSRNFLKLTQSYIRGFEFDDIRIKFHTNICM